MDARDDAIESGVAERRHLTVMFCDIVGSTELSGRMDPEDLSEVIERFQSEAAQIIRRHDGYIARYMGDGLLIYYGYPQAHEDDAERAVRCALELVTGIGSDDVVLRVGIATGSVVVGDVVGEGVSQEQSVVGQAPNLAARLQSLAPPHGVLIAPATRELVGDLFDCVDLGTQQIRGFEDPMTLWQVAGERRGISRFDSKRKAMVPFCGRDRELAVLEELGVEALESRGQVVTVIAEPGMGKSRLVSEFRSGVMERFGGVMRFNCAPHFRNTALYPISSRIEYEAGFEPADSADEKIAKLEDMLKRSGGGESLRYVAALISMLFGEGGAGAFDNPDQQKETILQALEEHIVNAAKDSSLLVLVEDLHWCDPTTLEFLQRLVVRLEGHPILLLATGRPEFVPPWKDLPNARTLTLERIDEGSCDRIIAELTQGKALPTPIREEIKTKSDRVPLYLEELTRSVVESQQAITVPGTLQDTLMERLDRLGTAKELAQLGAVLGRDFSRRLLARVAGLPQDELDNAVQKLLDAGVLHVFGAAANTSYRFKHALLRDAAYESLLNRTRRELHRRTADCLEGHYAELVRRQPELLAHHLTGAENWDQALLMWRESGNQATARATYREAIDHYRTALEVLPELDDAEQRLRMELELQGLLGNALARSYGYAAPEVETAFLRELELSGDADVHERCAALRRIGTFYIVRAEFERAREVIGECIDVAQANGFTNFQIDGLSGRGYVEIYTGEFRAAQRSLEGALNLYEEHNGSELEFVTEQDPWMASLAPLCINAWITGQCDRAAHIKEQLVATITDNQTPFDSAYAHSWAGTFELFRGDPQAARKHAETAIDISVKHSIFLWEKFSRVVAAFSDQVLSPSDEALTAIIENTVYYKATGALLSSSLLGGFQARAYFLGGNLDAAADVIEQTIRDANDRNEHWISPRLCQLKAEIAEAKGEDELFRRTLSQGIELARSQGAKLFELSALRSLVEHSDADHGRAALARALEDFPEHTVLVPEVNRARAALVR